jgi:hypothetical protein
MTPGTLNRDIVKLTLRIAAIEGNAKRAFIRLVIWLFVSAFAGAATVLFAYLKLHG